MIAISCNKPAEPAADVATTTSTIPNNAEDVRPLLVGEKLPAIQLNNMDGTAVSLNNLVTEKPTVLVFYRGGWCPYCNFQLGQLQSIESQLVALGYQVLAVSPDKPEKQNESKTKQSLQYQLLSDSSMEAAQALGIAFRLDDETNAKYKEYGIDLEATSGYTHHLLPVPAVWIIDQTGLIRFAYVNPNYKSRLDPELLLAAAKSALRTTDDIKL
ncbi:MAG: AhpC/TSA family protein [Gammaproteobacteria bacterium]|nr:AhpC/TSA family protein [Gammaproteobacteria bacterium]